MEKIFEMLIDENPESDLQVDFIALVDRPAIKKDFLAFNEQFIEPKAGEKEDEFIPRCIAYNINEGKEQDQAAAICYSKWENRFSEKTNRNKFQIQDEEKRIISGPIMVANQLIDRYDEENGAFKVFFSKETIRKIAIKMAQKGFQNNVNLMHDGDMKLEGVTLFEVFQSDKERGIPPMKGFEDLPDGSLFGSMYVGNEGAWELVKADMVKGFSVEGDFGMREVDPYESLFSEIVTILNSTKI